MNRLPPTILIVEDYPHHLKLVGDILRHEGYHDIRGATNIDDALKRIQEFQDETAVAKVAQGEKSCSQPRLIMIIDVGIPQSRDSLTLRRGGITLLEKLRKDYPELPAILLLTVYGEAEDVIETGRQYKVPVISKPLSSKQLLRVVRNILPH